MTNEEIKIFEEIYKEEAHLPYGSVIPEEFKKALMNMEIKLDEIDMDIIDKINSIRT